MNESSSPPTIRERVSALVVTSLAFIVVYNLTNYLSSLRSSVPTAAFEWELLIPLIPFMIVPYWSIDLFFAAAPFVCLSRTELRILVRRIIAAILIAGVCFTLFPLQLAFTRTEVQGPFGVMFNALFSFDRVFNLAPSLHISFRTILWMVYVPKLRGAPQTALKAWFILIGVSTLLCHQHQVIDIFTGQLLGQFVIHLFPLSRASGVKQTVALHKRRRLGGRYVWGAMLCLAATYFCWLPGVVLLWPALALTIVGGAYIAGRPDWFRKTNGCYSWTTRWLLMPYTFGSHLSYLWYTRSSAPYALVAEGVYFGRRLSEKEAEELRGLGVRRVLDLTGEFEETEALRTLEYQNIPVLDLIPPSDEQIDQALEWLQRTSGNGPVYIHCALGFSRSAIVTAAWLIRSGRTSSIDAALEKLRAAQPRLVVREEAISLLAAIKPRHE